MSHRCSPHAPEVVEHEVSERARVRSEQRRSRTAHIGLGERDVVGEHCRTDISTRPMTRSKSLEDEALQYSARARLSAPEASSMVSQRVVRHTFMRIAIAGATLFAIAGCARSTPPVNDARAAGERTTPPCEGDARCSVVQRHDAGHDASGIALTVWETSLGPRDVATRAAPTSPDADTCELREWWLERSGAFTLTLALCNDGYGAAGVGEDIVSFRDNAMEHVQIGGSAWRWSSTFFIQLWPRRMLRESQINYWAVGRNAEERQMDYTTYEGGVVWYAPLCDAPEDESEVGIAEIPEGLARAYMMLPALAIDASFDPSRMDASRCGTHVDGTGERGFLLRGEGASASDASLDIVTADEGTMTIIVHDDVLVPSGATRGDVLRVLVSSETPSYYEHCLHHDSTYESVLFDASSGRVLEGNASVLSPTTGAAPNGRYVQIRIPYEEHRGAVTISYSDVDAPNGPTERVFATSDFRENDVWSLGTRVSLYANSTRCTVEGSSLVREHRDAGVVSPFDR